MSLELIKKVPHKLSWFNISVVWVIKELLSSVFLWNIKIDWLENIPTDWNFLLLANHPSFLDFFIVLDIFERLWVDIKVLVHRKSVQNLLSGPYLKKKWHIWVLPVWSEKYFIRKYGLDKGKQRRLKRLAQASRFNIWSIKKVIESFENWDNIMIFVTWAWYQDTADEIFRWYEFLIKKIIKNDSWIIIVPLVIKFDWKKRSSFPMGADMSLCFYPWWTITEGILYKDLIDWFFVEKLWK